MGGSTEITGLVARYPKSFGLTLKFSMDGPDRLTFWSLLARKCILYL